MSDPIYSPDGKHIWNGTEWVSVPQPTEQKNLIQDSVIMGDVKNETNISINNLDAHSKIENYCDLYLYRISKDDIDAANEVLEMSKQTNLRITEQVFKGARLFEVSQQVLTYVRQKIESFVNLTNAFIESRIDAIQSGQKILIPVIGLMKSHVENLLEYRSNVDVWDLSDEQTYLCENLLMEFKHLGLILLQAMDLLRSVSDAILKSPTEKISLLLSSSDMSDLNLKLISITQFDCNLEVSEELSELYKKLPSAEHVSDDIRLDSLKNELTNLQNEIYKIENMPISINQLPYTGGVLISGEVQLLFQFKELRQDLVSILLHVDSPGWNELKHIQIEANGYTSPVSCWMGSKDEILEAMKTNSIGLRPHLSFMQKQQYRIMLESLYNVGENLGKMKRLLRPAWGKIDQLSGKYYHELVGHMGTVFSICQTSRYAIQRILSDSDWEEIHAHPSVSYAKPLGFAGERMYKRYDLPLGSAPGELGCFIATAAYGSELHWKIDILRHWRDFHLRESKFGRFFIRVYYTYSPRISKIVSRSLIVKGLTRLGLYPVVLLVSLRIKMKFFFKSSVNGVAKS